MHDDPYADPTSSDQPPDAAENRSAPPKPIRRRPPVATQPKAVQERCLQRGAIFAHLEQMKAAHDQKLPRGALQAALAELGLSKARFVQLWKHQYEPYRRAFPDTDPAEAFSPYAVAGGRPRGRDIPADVTQTIQRLYKERGFQSLNYDGSTNSSRLPVLSKGILSGVQTLFPDHADAIQLHDVYAAINDLWKQEAAHVHLARGNESMLTANLATCTSDVAGSDEQWQIDIRVLPGYIRYGDGICTVLSVVIADRWSGKIWAGRLIPGVNVRRGKVTDEDVWSGDYKAQEMRDVLAIAIWRAQRCCGILYPDNGPHFKHTVLGPYMPYLASESRDGTQVYRPQLINRTPEEPRGGGFIENLLGQLDSWLRKFYGHQDEAVEQFRAFYRMVNKDVAKLPTFETVAKDFQGHIRYLNEQHREEADRPTREERWKEGPDKSLPMPPVLNLALFAKQVKKDTRKVQRYGFDYNGKRWECVRDDPEIRTQLVQAALSSEKREIIVMKIGRETIVLMNLSGDGRTYEQARPKGKPRNTVKHARDLNHAARRIIEAQNRADSAALAETIRSQLAGGSLVIHPAGKKLIAQADVLCSPGSLDSSAPLEWQETRANAALAPGQGQTLTAGANTTPAHTDDTSADEHPIEPAPAQEPSTAIGKTEQHATQHRRKDEANAKKRSEPSSASASTDDQNDDDDDWADFAGLAW